MDGAYLRHASLSPRISGNARLIPGIIDNALHLDGSNQYVDLGDLRNECLGNLDLCPNGITFSSWINFQNFDENMYIFSSGYNGIRMFYKDGNINTVVQHNGKEWSTKVPKLDLDNWNYVEFTWHPDFGLKMFLNNTLVGEGSNIYQCTGCSGQQHSSIHRPQQCRRYGRIYPHGQHEDG